MEQTYKIENLGNSSVQKGPISLYKSGSLRTNTSVGARLGFKELKEYDKGLEAQTEDIDNVHSGYSSLNQHSRMSKRRCINDTASRRRASDKTAANQYSLNNRIQQSQSLSKSQYSKFPLENSTDKTQGENNSSVNVFTRNANGKLTESVDQNYTFKSVKLHHQNTAKSIPKDKDKMLEERREQNFFKTQSKNVPLNYNKEFSATLRKTASKINDSRTEDK